MKTVNMANFSLSLTVNLDQILEKLQDGETFDRYIGMNLFPMIKEKLNELGIEGSVGFQHYAHHYIEHKDE